MTHLQDTKSTRDPQSPSPRDGHLVRCLGALAGGLFRGVFRMKNGDTPREIYDDLWWSMILWWFMILFNDDLWWFMIIIDDLWLSLMIMIWENDLPMVSVQHEPAWMTYMDVYGCKWMYMGRSIETVRKLTISRWDLMSSAELKKASCQLTARCGKPTTCRSFS